MTPQERFWSYVLRGAGCWLWQGATKVGYGKYTVAGRPRRHVLAHRYAWELSHGPVPAGLFVCHRCDTPACVRPDHLFLGTAKDNSQDRDRKGRGARLDRERNNNAKLDETTVVAIRYARALSGCLQRELGDALGINQTCVSKVLRGVRWAT